MLEIQLPKCIEARLCRFAKETGRSETALVKEALDHYLDDLEDVYFSDKVVQRIRDGREDVVSSEEMAQMRKSCFAEAHSSFIDSCRDSVSSPRVMREAAGIWSPRD